MSPKVAGAPSVGALASLRALDNGAYAGAIARYEKLGEGGAGDLGSAIWRAEVATYLYRLEEASVVLEDLNHLDANLDEYGVSGNLARRRALLGGELALLRGEYAAAEVALVAVCDRARGAADHAIEMRAHLNLARLARARCEWELALVRCAEGLACAQLIGNLFYQGYALYNRAAALTETGATQEAEQCFCEALRLLRRTEDLRFRAHAENALAGLLAGMGRAEEAFALLVNAEATHLRLGTVNDVQIVRHAAAWVLFAAGRVAEARTRALDLLEMDRAGGDARAELFGLKLLACLACVGNRFEEARGFADEFCRLAEVAGAEADIFEARLVTARAGAKAGCATAFSELQTLIREADCFHSGAYSAHARLFLADALLAREPVAGGRALEEARVYAQLERVVWVRAELAALELAWAGQSIRFTSGELVLALDGPLPSRQAAHRALDEGLVAEALARSGGSYAEAGRLLGETRWNTRYLAYQLGLAPHVTAQDGRRKRGKRPALEEVAEE